jgi:hypothetical protein
MCLLWSTNRGFISQKTTFFIVTTVKTSNLTCFYMFTYSMVNWTQVTHGIGGQHGGDHMAVYDCYQQPSTHCTTEWTFQGKQECLNHNDSCSKDHGNYFNDVYSFKQRVGVPVLEGTKLLPYPQSPEWFWGPSSLLPRSSFLAGNVAGAWGWQLASIYFWGHVAIYIHSPMSEWHGI